MSEANHPTPDELCPACEGRPAPGNNPCYVCGYGTRTSNDLLTKLRWIGSIAAFKEPDIARACADAAGEIERLTRERDEWAAKWHRLRAELAELKYLGMKGVVRPLSGEYPPSETNDVPAQPDYLVRCCCGWQGQASTIIMRGLTCPACDAGFTPMGPRDALKASDGR